MRPPAPIEYFGERRGRGSGTLEVDGVIWPLQVAELELYHCASDEADWSFFAWTPRPHGEGADSTGVAFHGTVRMAGAVPRSAAELVDLRLVPAADQEGWEADYRLADGRAAVLAPAEGSVLEVVSAVDDATVVLRMRASLEGYVLDDAGDWPCAVRCVLASTASLTGLWPGRRGG